MRFLLEGLEERALLAVSLSISAVSGTRPEGNSGITPFTFIVTRSGDLGGVTSVNYNVFGVGANAADAADFGGATPSGQVVFGVGDTSKTIIVPVTGDTVVEPDEVFAVTLFNPVPNTVQFVQNQAFGVILNDDTGVSITTADAVKFEGDSGVTPFVFTITRAGDLGGATTVNWAVIGGPGPAADAGDFVGGVIPGGQITFNPGATTQTIVVLVRGDVDVEPDEEFTLRLSGPGNPLIAQTTATIVNDDESYAIETIPSNNGAGGSFNLEGNSGVTPFFFNVVRTGYSGDTALVNWMVDVNGGPGSADANDFNGGASSGQLFFNPGVTLQTIAVFVNGDVVPESNETFNVTLSNGLPSQTNVTIASVGGTSATAAGTIENDDPGYVIAPFSVSHPEGNGGATPFFFTVTRMDQSPDADANNGGGPIVLPTSPVFWSVTGRGAHPADALDFVNGVLPGGALFLNNGESQLIAVLVQGDTVVEPDETFTVSLESPGGGPAAAASGTIQNDDGGVAITAADAVKFEGNSGVTPFTFVVTRPGDSGGPLSLSYQVNGGGGNPPADANDFGGALPFGQVVFGSGEATKTITVFVAGDTLAEPDENFTVTLFNPVPNTIQLAQNQAVGTILNDDSFVQNRPPTLAAIPDQTAASPGSRTVILVGSDPDGGPLTYSATAQSLPFALRTTYGLHQDGGTYYQNARGQQEKYLKGTASATGYSDPGGYYYYILPSGDLFEFTPPYNNLNLTGAFVGNVGTAAYNDPTLITNAPPSANVNLSIVGNQLTITAPVGVAGVFLVTADVSDGQAVAARTFRITFTSAGVNQPPTLSAIPDQTLALFPATRVVTLSAFDPDNDPLTYSAQAQSLAAFLDGSYNLFQDPGGYYQNARGQQEKYLKGTASAVGFSDPAGYYYYILPNGDLFEFTPPYNNPNLTGVFLGNVGTSAYNDPTQVTNPSLNPPGVGLAFNGDQLTISAGPGYAGTAVVTAAVSDGFNPPTRRIFKVTVG